MTHHPSPRKPSRSNHSMHTTHLHVAPLTLECGGSGTAFTVSTQPSNLAPPHNYHPIPSLPKPFPIQHPRAPHKLPCRDLLTPFLFDVRNFQLAASPANHFHPILLHQNCPRLPSRRAAHRPPPQMTSLPPKFRIRPRP